MGDELMKLDEEMLERGRCYLKKGGVISILIEVR